MALTPMAMRRNQPNVQASDSCAAGMIELGNFQTGRKKGDYRHGDCGFAWHREGQGKKSHHQTDYCGQNQTEEWALRH